MIEVVSPSSERRDRKQKFRSYREIPTLQEYLLVSSTDRDVELLRRVGENWIVVPLDEQGPVTLQCLDADLSMDEIYAGIDFMPEPAKEA